ncbi:MAG TPA: hypothetical protein VLJ37_03675 [bacterium]|nr:hypothetical protein [bacterium]
MAIVSQNSGYVLNQTLFGLWLSAQQSSSEPRLEDANLILDISKAHGELPADFEAAPWLRLIRQESARPDSSAVPPLFARRLEEASSETLHALGNFLLGHNVSLASIASRHQRQEVRDLIEAESYRRLRMKPANANRLSPELKAAMGEIDEAEGSLYDVIRQEFGGQAGDAEDALELIHEIVHRNRPLDLIVEGSSLRARVEAFMDRAIQITERACPEDWGGNKKFSDRDVVSGAALLGRKDKVFRYAWMILNARLGRPLLGPPAMRERAAVIDFAVSLLNEDVRNFPEALIRIRDHFDRCTPEALTAISRADMETRAYVAEAYFGLFPFRVVPDLAPAFRLVRAIGEAGFYREIAVGTFPRAEGFGVNLSLGDLAGVNAEDVEDVFVLHTHPWVEYLSPEDTARFSIEDSRFVFSKPDIENAKAEALRLHREAEAGRTWFSPLSFNTDARRHSQWLQAYEGAAAMEVSVGAEGMISGIRMFYGLHPERNSNVDEEALLWRLAWFEHMYENQSGAPIRYIRRSYEDLLAEFPYRP